MNLEFVPLLRIQRDLQSLPRSQRFEAYLRGFASYINMVHPEEGATLLRQVEELLGTEKSE